MEVCVLDAVAIYFAYIEVGLHRIHVFWGNAVGGTVDVGWSL